MKLCRPELNEFQQKRIDELEKKCKQARSEIDKATNIGAFIISDEISEVLHKLKTRKGLDWKTNAPFEVFGDKCEAYKKAIKDIRSLAKKDLGVGK